jgi:hypothetical protein
MAFVKKSVSFVILMLQSVAFRDDISPNRKTLGTAGDIVRARLAAQGGIGQALITRRDAEHRAMGLRVVHRPGDRARLRRPRPPVGGIPGRRWRAPQGVLPLSFSIESKEECKVRAVAIL